MIDWIGFVIVALTTLVGAGFVVVMYSLGVRLTAVSGDDDSRVSQAAKWGSYICFGFCILAVALGIVLIVPHFSGPFLDMVGHWF
ncbi:hypothetical protein [Arthrobacter sp. GMC3]|uniref:hypothetical protein n=1 Tax=Arthrobacter sp. GMC3 TaxID=2058894 RepID=UPI000CE473E8|nr:hypothetical protein [Arthrobacter sp. GMC3]